MSITVTSMSTTVSSIRALSSAGTSASASNGAASGTANSSEAAIVATLGGSGNRVQIYDGSGLLSQIRQIQAAGDAAASAYSPAASVTTSSTISATTSSNGSTTSAASTSTPASGTDVTANWATILKTRPELTGVAIGYAFDQGIVNTLSTYA
jgi:hypothetical protein